MLNKVIKLFFSLSLMCLFLYTPVLAQDQSWSEVMEIDLKNLGPIYDNEEVKGYYMFYEVEKENRKTKKYLLQFLDNNLNVMAKEYITGSNHLSLIEGDFNGKNILLTFMDSKEKLYIYRQYNTSAELVSKTTKDYDPKLAGYASIGTGARPVPNQGFINVEMVKNKKWGYEINFISNEKGAKGWTYKSDVKSKAIESASIIGVNEELLLVLVSKMPKMMSKEVNTFLLGIDAKTGKKRFLNSMEDTKYNTEFTTMYADKESGELTLMGSYYNKSDRTSSDKSKGLCIYTMGTDGEIISKKYLGWTKEIKKILPVNKKGKLTDMGYMYFQNIFKTNDGRLFAVAEQYRKSVDALGVTANIVSGLLSNVTSDMSNTNVKIEDIMVLEFSADHDLTDVAVFEKNKSTQSIPAGGTFTNMHALGHLTKMYGGFDYVFTQQHRDTDVFSFVFNDYDRKSKNWDLKSVTYTDGAYSTDQIALTSSKSDFILLQGKKGHVMLAEYDSKAKKLDMRLEKINF